MPISDLAVLGQDIIAESHFGDGFRDDFHTLDIETSAAAGNRTGKWKNGFIHANMAQNGFTYGSDENTANGDNFIHAAINHETQAYVDPRKPHPSGWSPFSIEDGVLKITSRPIEASESTYARVKGYELDANGSLGTFRRDLPAKYLSGMLSTYGRFAMSFGRYRWKVKSPYGAIGSSSDINQRSAIFPAPGWLLQDIPYGMDINGEPFGDGSTTYRPGRPNGGGILLEIDADESFGESTTALHQTVHTHVAGTANGASLSYPKTITHSGDLRNVWRESGVDVFPEKIAFFVDGIYTHIVNTPDEVQNGLPLYEPIEGQEYNQVMSGANAAKVVGRQKHSDGSTRYMCFSLISNLARDGKYPRDLARQVFTSGGSLPAHSGTVSMEIDWAEARPLITDNPDNFPMRIDGVPTKADGTTGGTGSTGGTSTISRKTPFISYAPDMANGQIRTAVAELPANSDGSQPSHDDYTYSWVAGNGISLIGESDQYKVDYTVDDLAEGESARRLLYLNYQLVDDGPVTLPKIQSVSVSGGYKVKD